MYDGSILSALFLAEQGFFSSSWIARLVSGGFEPICGHCILRYGQAMAGNAATLRALRGELTGARCVG
ncbi:hypothetical protein GXB81_27430 [Paraburkholderia sp. Ac-20336]|uniref:hypothetical protein n=1 Tax=Paraburkholderia sp. Ac-20336 TaxID=2703886 RepID=UPI0019823BB9|nr:hypothetical protein [Paraburkholderia sp. Ac-20336]MBN3806751.1 hypothetical protein [Paraburkholderia sp. Ac-20336]